MISFLNKENCCGCNACCTVCPLNCIKMVADNEGFLYPFVNTQLCAYCGVCEKVCPMSMTLRQGGPPVAFAAWHREATVRSVSSSGGVFSALMQKSLQQGGIVIGAAFDNNMSLCHQIAQNITECHKFRGSKYLQSDIGNVYREAQVFLQQGRQILFSGTPCQVAGLYAFLGEDCKNLLTCDLVCHGVPSPKVFTAYRKTLECQHGAKVRKVDFRRKDYGWKQFSIALLFDNDTEYHRVFHNDPFMHGFLHNLYLRPSCHACRFSRLPRVADISIADFWGVGKHHPEWDDDQGTSLILIQSKKGQSAFYAIRDALVVHDADLDMAISSNPCICGSVSPSQDRAAFFSDLDRLSFENVTKKYLSPTSPLRRVINFTRRLVSYGAKLL